MSVARLWPSTYSMAMNGPTPGSSPTSKMVTMFGWLSWAEISASRWNRLRAWARSAPAAWTTLIATRRLSSGSSAR